MSSKLVVEIWHCPYGDASTILVLMALADEATDKGEYTADMATIARKARQSQRNCRYLLRKLENLEIVECLEERGRGHRNSYRIRTENLHNLQEVPVIENRQPLPVKAQRKQKQHVTVEEKAQNLQEVPVIENLQKVQPLPVIKPAKPANTATIAGSESPFPLDPLTPVLNQDLPPIVPPGDVEEKVAVTATKKKGRLDTNYTPGFNKWWAVYPADRRTDKPKCFEVWQAEGLENKADDLVAKIERLKRTTWNRKRDERHFIKTSLPYLNGGRFDDELVPLDCSEDTTPDNRPFMG